MMEEAKQVPPQAGGAAREDRTFKVLLENASQQEVVAMPGPGLRILHAMGVIQ